jgi:mRNA-degrading endonuclease RelE of RelBE toxin-antitoxin system
LNPGKGKKVYRLPIGHRYTVFYRIGKAQKIVYITDVMTIEQAHKNTAFFD